MAWSLVSINGWCWTILALAPGMRFLSFPNKRLDYGQQGMVPFFLFHQPVIVIIAFIVVRWIVGIVVKLPPILLTSFVITLADHQAHWARTSFIRDEGITGGPSRSRTTFILFSPTMWLTGLSLLDYL